MQKTIIVTAFFALFPLAFCWVQLELIQRLFLIFSNVAMIPALKQAAKHKAWFEYIFILMMGTVSIVYHMLFDLTETWGPKFRQGDWALALTAPYVLLHYVFRTEISEFKTIANFWALFISYSLTTYFQDHIFIYAVVLVVWTIILLFSKDRHFCAIPTSYLIWTLSLMSLGVLFFILADFLIYWILHSYWHFAAFVGMYWIMKVGPSGTPEFKKPEHQELPTVGIEASSSVIYVPHPMSVRNGMLFDL